jgi:predicted RNase H-like nuclease
MPNLPMKFLGIDLGWSTGASGLCCLEWHQSHLRILDLQCRTEMAEILAWVETWLPYPQPGMIAVDAPTLIPNPTGMRQCDRLAHQYFGRAHAGCYPANQGLSFAQRTVEFGVQLEQRGFSHAPEITAQHPGRYQIEVFPHAATLYLFSLTQIIKYKKGRLGERRQGLSQLRRLILEQLSQAQPALQFTLPIPEIPTTGLALKAVEDQLDSLICAYVAAHWWVWGQAKNLVLGEQATGYIVVPFAHPEQVKV